MIRASNCLCDHIHVFKHNHTCPFLKNPRYFQWM